MTGLRTVLLGLLIAIGPVATQYLMGVDWSFLPPWAAFAISGVLMVAMRYFTTTSIGVKKPE